MENPKEESREFKERVELIRQQAEADRIKHNFKMEELLYERETNKLFHDWALERERIKRAENRKDFTERKSYGGAR